MAFKKGREKTGGRKKGVTNKASKPIKEILSSIVEEYYNSDQFAQDLAALEPKDRLEAINKMSPYILAKLQNISGDLSVTKTKTIEDELAARCGE